MPKLKLQARALSNRFVSAGVKLITTKQTERKYQKLQWLVGGGFHTNVGDEFLYPLMEVRRRPGVARVEVEVVAHGSFSASLGCLNSPSRLPSLCSDQRSHARRS